MTDHERSILTKLLADALHEECDVQQTPPSAPRQQDAPGNAPDSNHFLIQFPSDDIERPYLDELLSKFHPDDNPFDYEPQEDVSQEAPEPEPADTAALLARIEALQRDNARLTRSAKRLFDHASDLERKLAACRAASETCENAHTRQLGEQARARGLVAGVGLSLVLTPVVCFLASLGWRLLCWLCELAGGQPELFVSAICTILGGFILLMCGKKFADWCSSLFGSSDLDDEEV